MNNRRLIENSLVAAIYVCLSLILGAFSFGPIQFRVSEMLMILCLIKKDYIYSLSLGCLLTNVIGLSLGLNYLPLDFIFGTIGTFLSGYFMYKFKYALIKGKPIIPLSMPAIFNGLIVSLELCVYTKDFKLFLINFIYIFISELIICEVFGQFIYKPLKEMIEQKEIN